MWMGSLFVVFWIHNFLRSGHNQGEWHRNIKEPESKTVKTKVWTAGTECWQEYGGNNGFDNWSCNIQTFQGWDKIQCKYRFIYIKIIFDFICFACYKSTDDSAIQLALFISSLKFIFKSVPFLSVKSIFPTESNAHLLFWQRPQINCFFENNYTITLGYKLH